jgi:predicted HTH transcriptional regulator
MSILHKLGYVEKHGTAYAKAVAAEEHGYPLPKWTEPGPILRVTLVPHPKALATTKPPKPKRRRNREDEIVEFLGQHGATTAAELAGEIGVSRRQISSYLKRLEENERVQSIGENAHDPKRAYRVV